MKRKVSAITLTAMMAAGMLAGCGSSDSSSSSTADTTKEASATEADGSTDGDSTAAGGDFSGQISVISREDGSGTRGAFIELFGVEEKNDAGEKVDNTTVDAQITNNTSVMMSTVAGNQHAIGYISRGSLNDEVKAMHRTAPCVYCPRLKLFLRRITAHPEGKYCQSRRAAGPGASAPAPPPCR